LNLSTRNSGGTDHDEDLPPEGAVRLMHPTDKGRWMRHEDWEKANKTAERRAQ